jgi:amino acid adenylation domain-containing protein
VMDNVRSRFPLTLAQSDIYFDQQRHPEDPTYNIGGFIRFGAVDVERLRAAHVGMVVGHSAFGLRIHIDVTGVSQSVSDERDVMLPLWDLSGERDPVAAATAFMDERFQRMFNIHDSVLYMAFLLRLSDRELRYCVIAHHLMIDGWGFANLARELARRYRGEDTGAMFAWRTVSDDDQQYLDGPRHAVDREYWTRRIETLPESILPVRHPIINDTRRASPSNRETWAMPVSDYAHLAAVAERHGVGLPQLLLGALALCAAHLGDQDTLLIGLPVHNRRGHAQKQAIGVFTGMMPLPITMQMDERLGDWLRTIADRQRGDYRHQRYPIGQLGRDLGLAGTGRRLFDVSYNHLKLDGHFEIGGQVAEIYYLTHGYSQTPLALTVWDYGQAQPVEFHFDHNLACMDVADARLFLRRYRHLLERIARESDPVLGELDLLLPDEASSIERFAMGLPVQATPEFAHQWFEAHARRTPDAVAVADMRTAVRYGALNRLSNRLARELVAAGVRPDDRIAICVGREWTWALGVLATLKAGAAYLPLDPGQPDARIGDMLADASVACCFATPSTAARLQALVDVPVIVLDVDTLDVFGRSPSDDINLEPSSLGLRQEHLAYVIFTSGSSGRPKGVMLAHTGLAQLAAGLQETYTLGPDDRVLQFSSFGFDAATWDWVRTFAAGASLHVCDDDTRRSGERLGHYLHGQGITHALIPPAALAHVDPAQATALRSLIVGGEACDPGVVAAWAPHVRLFNAYGPTEATVVASQAELSLDAPITIGAPLPGFELQVVDRHGRIVPIGATGELWIAGAGLARGYLDRQVETAQRFVEGACMLSGRRWYRTGDRVRRRNDGLLEFLGRIDRQVKLRGFRIEIGEIESALLACADVSSAVVDTEGEGTHKRLVAWVVASTGTADDALFSVLRNALSRRLPEYMIPAAWVGIDRMPLNASGKIDRFALQVPQAQEAGDGSCRPSTDSERRIATLWEDVLGEPVQDVEADFFLLGGHSLSASRLAARLGAEFGCEVALRTVFEHRSIRRQAMCIADIRAMRTDIRTMRSAIAPMPTDTRRRLSFQQRRLWLIERIQGPSAQYNIPGALRLHGALDIPALQTSLHALIQRHHVLRTALIEDPSSDEPLQILRATFPQLRLVNLCGTPSSNRGAELSRQWVAEAKQPVVLDGDSMLRATLIRFADDDHALLLTLHHIVADGGSMPLLLEDLGKAYTAALLGGSVDTVLPPMSLQYADYAAWQRNEYDDASLAQALTYWRAQLSDAPPLHALPLDYSRSSDGAVFGAHFGLRLSNETINALTRLAQARGATLFMAMHALLAVLISRWSGEDDLVIGTPVSGRQDRSLDPLIGFFVDTIALRTHLEGDPDFDTLLAHSRSTLLDAFTHRDLPFERLVADLAPARIPGASPIFQILFSLDQEKLRMPAMPGLQVERCDSDTQPVPLIVDLDIAIERDNAGYRIRWHYRPDLFDISSIERLAHGFQRLLSAVVAQPQSPISRLPLLSEDELSQIERWEDGREAGLEEGRETETQYSPVFVPAHVRVDAHARLNGDAAAILDGDSHLDYAMLERESNRLANWLAGRGIGPGSRVGVCLERGWG